jgi:hypothetical protein
VRALLHVDSDELTSRFFADILLTPLEATRIRLVSDPKVSFSATRVMQSLTRQYATGLVSGLTKIASTEGFSSLYAGFIPILCKQVPYAIGRFASNATMFAKLTARSIHCQRAMYRVHLRTNESGAERSALASRNLLHYPRERSSRRFRGCDPVSCEWIRSGHVGMS